MGNDLPDYQSRVETTLADVTSIDSGLDAAKSASPGVGDIYLATDTARLYLCYTAGTWTGFDIRLNVVTQSQPVRALDTEYQASTQIRVINVYIGTAPGEHATLYDGAASPPATEIARVYNGAGNADDIAANIVAIIPPLYYYKITSTGGAPTLLKWTEWDLLG